MRKFLGRLFVALFIVMISIPLSEAQENKEYQSIVEVTEADKAPVLILTGKGDLLDSLKAVIDIVNDPKIVEVLNNAVEVIKATPTDKKDPNEWFNYITGIVAALSALITLILAKGKAIYNTLTKKKSN